MKPQITIENGEMYVVTSSEDGCHTFAKCIVARKIVNGKIRHHFVNTETWQEVFPGRYFDFVWEFSNGLALVADGTSYYHINMHCEPVYPLKFVDVAPAYLPPNGIILVQYRYVEGWNYFDVWKRTFLSRRPLNNRQAY